MCGNFFFGARTLLTHTSHCAVYMRRVCIAFECRQRVREILICYCMLLNSPKPLTGAPAPLLKPSCMQPVGAACSANGWLPQCRQLRCSESPTATTSSVCCSKGHPP